MKNRYFKVITLLVAGLFFAVGEVKAQVDLGVDIMSRYVWRGFEFGNSPSIQPELSYTQGGFEIGVWGAFATSGDLDGTEVDIFASYTFETANAGSFSLIATDYTFPVHHTGMTGSETWFSSDAHFIELGIGYEGPEEFPISIFAGMFVHNDDDNSVYIEVGYDTGPIDLFVGLTPSESAAYGTTGAGVINLGFGSSKELRITDSFAVDLSASVITNPYEENLFFVFGIGF
jgi:hypothetical protein